MNIQDEINRIKHNVTAAYNAAYEKGAATQSPESVGNLAKAVESIPVGNAVQYVQQTLNPEEQKQARENISAGPKMLRVTATANKNSTNAVISNVSHTMDEIAQAYKEQKTIELWIDVKADDMEMMGRAGEDAGGGLDSEEVFVNLSGRYELDNFMEIEGREGYTYYAYLSKTDVRLDFAAFIQITLSNSGADIFAMILEPAKNAFVTNITDMMGTLTAEPGVDAIVDAQRRGERCTAVFALEYYELTQVYDLARGAGTGSAGHVVVFEKYNPKDGLLKVLELTGVSTGLGTRTDVTYYERNLWPIDITGIDPNEIIGKTPVKGLTGTQWIVPQEKITGEYGQIVTIDEDGNAVATTLSIPQRGVDYWTVADQEQVVQDVLLALPVYDGEVETV